MTTNQEAMTLEQVRDWHIENASRYRRAPTPFQEMGEQFAKEHDACANAIAMHIAAEKRKAAGMKLYNDVVDTALFSQATDEHGEPLAMMIDFMGMGSPEKLNRARLIMRAALASVLPTDQRHSPTRDSESEGLGEAGRVSLDDRKLEKLSVPIVLPPIAVSEIKDMLAHEYGLYDYKARPLWAQLLKIVAGISVEDQEKCHE